MKKLLLALFAFTVLFSACKDDSGDDGGTTAKTKTDLITEGSWKISAATSDPPIVILGVEFSDFMAMMDECDKDDLTTYMADGSGTFDEGATKCDPADPQTENFTWKFINNEAGIVQDGDTFEVTSITETEMKLQATMDGEEIGDTTGTSYTLKGTWTK